MSAFVVDRTHIDILLASGLNLTGTGYLVSWYAVSSDQELRRLTESERQAAHRELRPETADRVGHVLVRENFRSVRGLYPDAEEGGRLPGAISSHILPYHYSSPRYWPTPVETLAAIACYEYQSCEHEEWVTSEALRFCEALRMAMIWRLPGYNAAPWEWTPEVLLKARASLG